jgi:predicted TIM-barrel fold metal-dependent hydrolase
VSLQTTAGTDPAQRDALGPLEQGLTGGWDPQARLVDMDTDGVEIEVLYPTLSFGMWKAPDVAYQYACMRAYNHWIADYVSTSPGRLIGLGLVSLRDVPAAIEEATRIAHTGLKGLCIAATAPRGQTYADPGFDPFWAAAHDLGLPVSLHVLTGSEEDRDTSRDFVADYTLWPRFIQQTIADVIAGGVLERFPNLKLISAEIDIGWIGSFLSRIDHAYQEHRHWSGACAQLKMRPSEYFHRQVYATFMDDAAGIAARHFIGVDNIMWGNDYPHPDACWPHSVKTIERIFQGVPEAETRKIVHDNAARLYGLR